MGDLQKLKARKKVIKSSLTRFGTYLSSENVDTAQLKLRLQAIEPILTEFNNIQNEIDNLEESGNGEDESNDFENTYFSLCTEAHKLIQAQINIKPHEEEKKPIINNCHQIIKLPQISLPIFSGSYEKFKSFYESFKSLIESRIDLDDIQKLHYLKSCLRGDALQVISALEISAQNYGVAWELLKQRFDNQRLVVNRHLKAIFECEKIDRESSVKLRNMIDNTMKHVRALQSLEIPVQYWDIPLIFVLSQKLDQKTHRQWESVCNKDSFPSLQKFIDFLQNQAQTLEAIEPAKYARGNKNYQKVHTNNATVCASTSAGQTSFKCPFCTFNHKAYYCRKLLSANLKDKWDMVNKAKLCVNCLSDSHKTEQCNKGNCKHCSAKHNSLLHKDEQSSGILVTTDIDQNETKEEEVMVHSISATHSRRSTIMLSTAIINIVDHQGKMHHCRALLDSGSQINCLTERLAQVLGISSSKRSFPICGIGGTTTIARKSLTTKILSRDNSFACSLDFVVIPKITFPLPSIDLDITGWKIPNHIMLADPSFHKKAHVDMLIGASEFFNIISSGQIPLGKNLPILQSTKVGWIVVGEYREPPSAPIEEECIQQGCFVSLEDAISKFWELEELPTERKPTPEERECEKLFTDTTKRHISGRFEVKLPFKSEAKKLGLSKETAFKRFLSLERRLTKTPAVYEQYRLFMREYLELGHMEQVTELVEPPNTYYMPHHAVVNEGSSTTKLRVVFDASCKSESGASLNDILKVGPVVQDDLVGIIMRFRKHQYVITADITKMYRQILVSDADSNFQRIFWRDNSQAEIEIYKLKTVTYGTASASYLATRCLIFLADSFKSSAPLGAAAIKHDFYVDDLLTGCDDLHQALQLQKEVQNVLNTAQFTLHKWCSNEPLLLNSIPPMQRESKYEINSNNPSVAIKTLGVWWNPAVDTFNFTIQPSNKNPITKRSILACIARIFDPLGLLGPVNLKAKLFMKKLWELNVGWDDQLSSELEEEWATFARDLKALEYISIPRHVIHDHCESFIEVHGFCDASEKAYGAAVYIKSKNNNGEQMVNILCSKSRVAPLKCITIPRLELCGALLLSQLIIKCIKSLKLNHEYTCHLWTDSTVVLGWLAQPSGNWKTFVSNRVAEIHELTHKFIWRHIKGIDNPCDILSRGAMPKDLIDHKIWWNGPNWLGCTSDDWPCLSQSPERSLPEARVSSCFHTQIAKPVVEFNRFSNFNRLINAVVYVWRFIMHLPKEPCQVGPITAADRSIAIQQCIRLVQKESFAAELDQLKRFNKLTKKSKLQPLTPFLSEDGLIRVGGRLKNAHIAYDQKHQILLPSDHWFTKLLIKSIHVEQLHAGPQLLLASVRQRYWPIEGKRLTRKIVFECYKCFHNHPKSASQIMGELPSERVTPSRPFCNSGVDFCGPIFIKTNSKRGSKTIKAYVSLFICLSTKAVHIELVGDLTAASFILALKRFAGRRGKPNNLFSDNGTNFVGAEKELKRDIEKTLNCTQLFDYSANEGIDWHFIPPRAPHFGGLWEAAIKSFKFHLRRIVGTALYTFEEMSTYLVLIESCLNSRPLYPLSENPNDFSALTPGHFLTGDSMSTIPGPNLTTMNGNRLERWRRVQQMFQHFWQRWSKEYLSTLQVRSKWNKETYNLKPGQLVLIKEDNLPPLKWQLGRIVETHQGKDGYTRVATVKTASGTIKRPITKLCPFPKVEESVKSDDSSN